MTQIIREKLLVAIEARGGKLVKITKKYIICQMPGDKYNYLYIGKSGALRGGTSVSTSVPLEHLKAKLLAEQEKV